VTTAEQIRPKSGPRPKPVEERFWPKVNREGPLMPGMTTPCWEWTGKRTAAGHGVIETVRVGPDGKKQRKRHYAHRLAYELLIGPIPQAGSCRVEVRHVCHHAPCCNPDHLEVAVLTDAKGDIERALAGGVTKLCECGCGQPAPIARLTIRSRGIVAGQPLRFREGHYPGTTQETFCEPVFDRELYAVTPEPRFPQHPVAGKVCKCPDPLVLLDTDEDERCWKCGRLTVRMMMTTLLMAMGQGSGTDG